MVLKESLPLSSVVMVLAGGCVISVGLRPKRRTFGDDCGGVATLPRAPLSIELGTQRRRCLFGVIF